MEPKIGVVFRGIMCLLSKSSNTTPLLRLDISFDQTPFNRVGLPLWNRTNIFRWAQATLQDAGEGSSP